MRMTIEEWQDKIDELQIRGAFLLWELRIAELRGWITKNGRHIFIGDKGNSDGRVDKSGKSGIIKAKEPPKGYRDQTSDGLMSGIKKDNKQIEIHKDKINNPEKYVEGWDKRSDYYRRGIIKHWKTEIENFTKQIEFREQELERRKHNE